MTSSGSGTTVRPSNTTPWPSHTAPTMRRSLMIQSTRITPSSWPIGAQPWMGQRSMRHVSRISTEPSSLDTRESFGTRSTRGRVTPMSSWGSTSTPKKPWRLHSRMSEGQTSKRRRTETTTGRESESRWLCLMWARPCTMSREWSGPHLVWPGERRVTEGCPRR